MSVSLPRAAKAKTLAAKQGMHSFGIRSFLHAIARKQIWKDFPFIGRQCRQKCEHTGDCENCEMNEADEHVPTKWVHGLRVYSSPPIKRFFLFTVSAQPKDQPSLLSICRVWASVSRRQDSGEGLHILHPAD